jgi:hypothetical protein
MCDVDAGSGLSAGGKLSVFGPDVNIPDRLLFENRLKYLKKTNPYISPIE